MPIFEYVCQNVSTNFATLIFGRDKAKCPKCQSGKLSPQLSLFAVAGEKLGRARPPYRWLRLLRRSSRVWRPAPSEMWTNRQKLAQN